MRFRPFASARDLAGSPAAPTAGGGDLRADGASTAACSAEGHPEPVTSSHTARPEEPATSVDAGVGAPKPRMVFDRVENRQYVGSACRVARHAQCPGGWPVERTDRGTPCVCSCHDAPSLTDEDKAALVGRQRARNDARYLAGYREGYRRACDEIDTDEVSILLADEIERMQGQPGGLYVAGLRRALAIVRERQS